MCVDICGTSMYRWIPRACLSGRINKKSVLMFAWSGSGWVNFGWVKWDWLRFIKRYVSSDVYSMCAVWRILRAAIAINGLYWNCICFFFVLLLLCVWFNSAVNADFFYLPRSGICRKHTHSINSMRVVFVGWFFPTSCNSLETHHGRFFVCIIQNPKYCITFCTPHLTTRLLSMMFHKSLREQ